MRNPISAQSLICGNVDENDNIPKDEMDIVDNSEERVEDSENENGLDEEISSMASQIHGEIIFQRDTSDDGDGDTIPTCGIDINSC